MVSQYLHTHGWVDQINPERRRGDRCGFVAPEHLWSHPFSLEDPHWSVIGRRVRHWHRLEPLFCASARVQMLKGTLARWRPIVDISQRTVIVLMEAENGEV
jgi:hypothetical protein